MQLFCGAWIGGDDWKLAVESEGEYLTRSKTFETLENQLLVRRLCSLPVLLGLLWLVKPAWPCPALMRTALESR